MFCEPSCLDSRLMYFANADTLKQGKTGERGVLMLAHKIFFLGYIHRLDGYECMQRRKLLTDNKRRSLICWITMESLLESCITFQALLKVSSFALHISDLGRLAPPRESVRALTTLHYLSILGTKDWLPRFTSYGSVHFSPPGLCYRHQNSVACCNILARNLTNPL